MGKFDETPQDSGAAQFECSREISTLIKTRGTRERLTKASWLNGMKRIFESRNPQIIEAIRLTKSYADEDIWDKLSPDLVSNYYSSCTDLQLLFYEGVGEAHKDIRRPDGLIYIPNLMVTGLHDSVSIRKVITAYRKGTMVQLGNEQRTSDWHDQVCKEVMARLNEDSDAALDTLIASFPVKEGIDKSGTFHGRHERLEFYRKNLTEFAGKDTNVLKRVDSILAQINTWVYAKGVSSVSTGGDRFFYSGQYPLEEVVVLSVSILSQLGWSVEASEALYEELRKIACIVANETYIKKKIKDSLSVNLIGAILQTNTPSNYHCSPSRVTLSRVHYMLSTLFQGVWSIYNILRLDSETVVGLIVLIANIESKYQQDLVVSVHLLTRTLVGSSGHVIMVRKVEMSEAVVKTGQYFAIDLVEKRRTAPARTVPGMEAGTDEIEREAKLIFEGHVKNLKDHNRFFHVVGDAIVSDKVEHGKWQQMVEAEFESLAVIKVKDQWFVYTSTPLISAISDMSEFVDGFPTITNKEMDAIFAKARESHF